MTQDLFSNNVVRYARDCMIFLMSTWCDGQDGPVSFDDVHLIFQHMLCPPKTHNILGEETMSLKKETHVNQRTE